MPLLHDAVRKNDTTELNALIVGGADLSDRDHTSGDTVLEYAALEGRVECLKVLLDAKADVNYASDLGNVPLHAAAEGGSVECVLVGVERDGTCLVVLTLSG